MTNSNEFEGCENLLVLITGASRGIGKELARQLAIHFSAKKIHFFLLARNKEQLEKTKKIVEKCSSLAKVESVVADLSAQPFDEAEKISEKVKMLNNEINFDCCLIVHNAGTLGDLTKKSSELNDQIQWHEYLQTNLISTIHLNNKIFDTLQNGKKDIKLFIVNITSLLSVKAYPSFTQYSVGKAAREAYFRAFATEHPKCRVLNYSPGPVDTDMHLEVCQKTYDQGVRQVFSTQRHDANLHRKLLTPEETVKRLIQLIEENKFENGARVDYFDK